MCVCVFFFCIFPVSLWIYMYVFFYYLVRRDDKAAICGFLAKQHLSAHSPVRTLRILPFLYYTFDLLCPLFFSTR